MVDTHRGTASTVAGIMRKWLEWTIRHWVVSVAVPVLGFFVIALKQDAGHGLAGSLVLLTVMWVMGPIGEVYYRQRWHDRWVNNGQPEPPDPPTVLELTMAVSAYWTLIVLGMLAHLLTGVGDLTTIPILESYSPWLLIVIPLILLGSAEIWMSVRMRRKIVNDVRRTAGFHESDTEPAEESA